MKKYNVTGMTCAACSARVEKAALSVNGVTSCAVNLLLGNMSVEGTANENEIISAVEKAGYGCSAYSEGLADKSQNFATAPKNLYLEESKNLFHRLCASVVFLLALMYISMGHTMFNFPLPPFLNNNPGGIALAQMLLAATVMLINGKFFASGIKAALRLSPNMDTLVSVGSGAAFIYSVAVLFLICNNLASGNLAAASKNLHNLYFESSAMILALITVGKTLEAKSKARTDNALKGLKNLMPETANVLRNGKEVTVKISEIVSGDIFTVRPGEQIPVDGFIIQGSTSVNEAAVTGESVPAEKSEGDTVIGATVNSSGFIKCQATRVGGETVLSKIIQTVSDANATKAPIAKTADKVASFFVPAVMAIALITAIVWLILGKPFGFALARAISVLVISCPCSLGLATPVAIMVGSGVGAKNGILFKNAQALETCAKIKTVALDKTGTVTSGNIKVTGVYPANGVSEQELLCAAYALEEKSEHPLAKAVVSHCRQNEVTVQNSTHFRADVGSGVYCKINKKEYFGGKYEYISESLKNHSVKIPQSEVAKANELSQKGNTPLYFANQEKYLGIIAAADSIKTESPAAIQALNEMGLQTTLISGDNELVTRAIAQKAGIKKVIFGATPNGKAQIVSELKNSGKIAMIGDGINDAPALASADVGMAIGTGTDIARDTAEIILMNGSLYGAVNAFKLSKAVLRNIKQNLFWAFFYNSVGIPVAAGVLAPLGITLSPMLGALAMGLSSFSVVTNALRLNRFKPKKNECLCLDNCQNDNITNNNITKITEEKTKMKKTFKVEGMMCQHCENHVKKALEALSGVESATASHTDGIVTVVLSKDVSDETIKAAIQEEGYKVL